MKRLGWHVGVAILVGICATAVVAATLALDRPDPNDRRFRSALGSANFDGSRYVDFRDYVEQTRRHLETNKVFMNPTTAARELEAATPFELLPNEGCQTQRPTRGVLLIHGLSDMPFAMRDLAEAFAVRCFTVRAILLPGHGARPADLLEVSHQDWSRAAKFGLATLKRDADEVFVGGFSLGGLLAVLTALEDSDVRGVFGFSPALVLQRSWSLSQTQWLRHIVDWADVGPQEDYARYEAMPFNALAEISTLTGLLAQSLRHLEVPVFIAQSDDDAVIDSVRNAEYFRRFFLHPHSRMLIYQPGDDEPDATDPRIQYINSYLVEHRVFAYSHHSVHIAPDNAHYGVAGDYRQCGGDTSNRSAEDVDRCLKADRPWHGEVFGVAAPPSNAADSFARLTYNPRFAELLAEIDIFLGAIH